MPDGPPRWAAGQYAARQQRPPMVPTDWAEPSDHFPAVAARRCPCGTSDRCPDAAAVRSGLGKPSQPQAAAWHPDRGERPVHRQPAATARSRPAEPAQCRDAASPWCLAGASAPFRAEASGLSRAAAWVPSRHAAWVPSRHAAWVRYPRAASSPYRCRASSPYRCRASSPYRCAAAGRCRPTEPARYQAGASDDPSGRGIRPVPD